MTATFFKNIDGDFDYGAIIASFIFLVLICVYSWIFYRGFKDGRFPYGLGRVGSPICYVEREKNPLGFWFVFVLYCLMVAFCFFMIVAMCFGVFQKPA
jgi:hypothetical protein